MRIRDEEFALSGESLLSRIKRRAGFVKCCHSELPVGFLEAYALEYFSRAYVVVSVQEEETIGSRTRKVYKSTSKEKIVDIDAQEGI
jgi:hypothetical protein